MVVVVVFENAIMSYESLLGFAFCLFTSTNASLSGSHVCFVVVVVVSLVQFQFLLF